MNIIIISNINNRVTGAHVGIYTETRAHSADRHARIINAFKSRGFLPPSDNATPRAVDCAPGSRQDEAPGPRAFGVIVVVSDTYAAGWTDIVYDTFGRAIAANLDLSDGATIRIIRAYGVIGSNCVNFVSFPAKKTTERFINEFISSHAKLCEKEWLTHIRRKRHQLLPATRDRP